MSEPRIRVEEKQRKPGEGLRMILSQEATFPKPIRVWNPQTGEMEARARMETLFDASIPEVQYANYEGFSIGRDSKERILILLASLGYSYPTTAIAEASNVAVSTSKRVLWEMRRDGLLEGAFSHGAYIDSELWPYRYGPLRENYYMLTEEGAEAAGRLMTMRVVPLVSPEGETPWDRAARIATETREKMKGGGGSATKPTPCDVCGNTDLNWDRGWWVSDEEWLRIVPEKWRNKTLCPWCFVKFARQKGEQYKVRYTNGIAVGVEKMERWEA